METSLQVTATAGIIFCIFVIFIQLHTPESFRTKPNGYEIFLAFGALISLLTALISILFWIW